MTELIEQTGHETDAWPPPLLPGSSALAEHFARQYGTPVFIYDITAIEHAHAALRAALPLPSTLYYSLKANPHPGVIRHLHERRCRSEVSSSGEVDAALGAGVRAEEILMTGPGKTETTLRHALARGVRRFSVDSPTDLERLDRCAQDHGVQVECLLRVNADHAVAGAGLSMTGTSSQFGADASWIQREPGRFMGGEHARVRGLHLYMGSNLTDTDALVTQFDVAIAVAAELRCVLPNLDEIDLGGGFGTPYAKDGGRPVFSGLRAALERRLDRGLPSWRDGEPRISFESGRYLVGDCGTLLARVVDLKESKGTRFAVLDTGVHHLGGMSGLRRIPTAAVHLVPVHEVVDQEPGEAPVTAVGPLCTPLDILGRNLDVPGLQVDDLIAIPNAGAYGVTASLFAFLGHPAPVEVLIRDGAVESASSLRVTRTAV